MQQIALIGPGTRGRKNLNKLAKFLIEVYVRIGIRALDSWCPGPYSSCLEVASTGKVQMTTTAAFSLSQIKN